MNPDEQPAIQTAQFDLSARYPNTKPRLMTKVELVRRGMAIESVGPPDPFGYVPIWTYCIFGTREMHFLKADSNL